MLLEALKKLGLGALILVFIALLLAGGGFLVAKAPIIAFILLLGFAAYFIGDLILD